MKLVISILFMICWILLNSQSVNAQYSIERGVFGNGGGITASTNNSITGTVGQTFVGISSNSNNGIYSGFWYANQTLVGVNDENLVPNVFQLYQNYPNPFNPSTTIKYSIPSNLNSSKDGTLVTLKIYDLLGREVELLVNEEKSPGFYKVNFNAANLASGIYLYRIKADNFVVTKKMILLK